MMIASAMVVLGQVPFGLPVFLIIFTLTEPVPRTWSEWLTDPAMPSGLYQPVALIVVVPGVYIVAWL
jgi:hypothetical protein